MPRRKIIRQSDDPVIQVLEEIRERGGELIEAFIDIREEELRSILPDLRALRDRQNSTLQALKELQNIEQTKLKGDGKVSKLQDKL